FEHQAHGTGCHARGVEKLLDQLVQAVNLTTNYTEPLFGPWVVAFGRRSVLEGHAVDLQLERRDRRLELMRRDGEQLVACLNGICKLLEEGDSLRVVPANET